MPCCVRGRKVRRHVGDRARHRPAGRRGPPLGPGWRFAIPRPGIVLSRMERTVMQRAGLGALLLAAALAGCGDDGGAARPTPTAPAATATAVPPTATVPPATPTAPSA